MIANATQPFLLPISTLETDLLLASGITNGCYQYRNYEAYDDYGAGVNGPVTQTANGCRFVAGSYGVTVDQMVQWNTSLDVNNRAVQQGLRHCVVHRQSDMRDCEPCPNRKDYHELD